MDALSCNRRVFGMENDGFWRTVWRLRSMDNDKRTGSGSGFYLSSHWEVWWIAESVLNMSRSRADGTMSSWLLYFRNFTNFPTVSYIIWTPLWTKCASAAAILSNISADGLEDISNKVPTVNPLTPKSNKHLISPYKITSDSHIQIMEIKEMIIK